MRLIVGHDQAIASWMGKKTGKEMLLSYLANGTPMQAVMGWIDSSGKICSAVVFNNFQQGGSIEAHICGRMTRQTLKEGMRYAFKQLNATRITACPKRGNKRITRILPRLGFVLEAPMKRFYGPNKRDDGLLFRLERHNAEKWLI